MKFLTSLLTIFVFLTTITFAAPQTMSQKHFECATIYEQRMTEVRDVMASKPSTEWTNEEIANYQMYMGAAVYSATVAYCMDNRRLPNHVEDVVGIYLMEWPLNPTNNWRPVQVLKIDEQPSFGDIVFQRCPFSYYSLSFDGKLEAESFEMSVYGNAADRSFIKLTNEDWATLPNGVIFSMGMYTEPALDVLSKMREEGL